jgi:hypothetical protein
MRAMRLPFTIILANRIRAKVGDPVPTSELNGRGERESLPQPEQALPFGWRLNALREMMRFENPTGSWL